jgi:GH24 family phage-related lysozyme (muramidase)
VKKFFIWALAVVGIFLGLVWWFDVEQTGGDFSDFFSDPVGGTTSLFSRLSLWVQGMVARFTNSGAGDTQSARTIAAGLIAGFEGFVDHAYPDPAGQTTTYSIGYGHQIKQGDGFDTSSTISEGDALALLQADIETYATCVDNVVTVPVSPQQAAALYSLCYNIGCAAFENSSLLGDLNIGDYSSAGAQFAVWNKSGGVVLSALVDRRASEAQLFNDNPAAAPAPDQTAQPTDVEASTDTTDTSTDDEG